MPASNPIRTVIISFAALFALLIAFALGFWFVMRGVDGGYNNRAQSQIRSAAEEASANSGWDPNRLLAGYKQELPKPGSWGDNFGRPLARAQGVDADSYLYPPGMAPAPGTWIEGDSPYEDPNDDLEHFLRNFGEPPASPLDGMPAATQAPSLGSSDNAAATGSSRPQRSTNSNANTHRSNRSPVDSLLN